MASIIKRKSSAFENVAILKNHEELFAPKENTEKEISSSDEGIDSTDSEDSIYSGLEEEDSTDDDGEDEPESLDESDEYSDTNEKESTKDSPSIPKEETKTNEYEQDSSDEEDIRNTIGNIPIKWYDEYPHIGYDVSGRQIIKPKKGDQIDSFLDKMENPDYGRTVIDKQTGQEVILTENDIATIENVRKGKYPEGTYNPYEPWVDFFTNEKMEHPVTNHPAHKRSFIPSLWERNKVSQYVHAMKMGWMKPRQDKTQDDDEPKFYDIWKDSEQSEISRRFRHHIPAPKLLLPGHDESYNPPPEYLFTEEEELAWKEKEPEDRRMNFIPQKYSSLRLVPSYPRFINERFERCLDLYLCPRQRKARMNVNPEDLIPKLPKPKDLQPFPTTLAIVYKGHKNLIRCSSIDPSGQWLVSGSDDETVKFWEVSTGRCIRTVNVGGAVKEVSWNPNSAICLVAIAVNSLVILLNPQLGDKLIISNTDNMLDKIEGPQESGESSKVKIEWSAYTGSQYNNGFRIKISHPKDVSQVTWHIRGDYFATVLPKGESMSVCISQLSKHKSQMPFKQSKGLVQKVLFHPTRPYLFVATQRYVRVYNLLKQELTKKLMTNCKWVSSMDVHPEGDNIIIGSYDARLSWFDMDLSTKPYQTLRHHKKAIRQVCYHPRYPLFASASDDGTIIVCHGKVYNDLMQNPLIVPVKILKGHEISQGLGVLGCHFHPNQPWLFSSGADNNIHLYT